MECVEFQLVGDAFDVLENTSIVEIIVSIYYMIGSIIVTLESLLEIIEHAICEGVPNCK